MLISQICFGNTVRLRFDDETRLDIESPFNVESDVGVVVVDPEGDPAAMSPVLPFLQQRVARATVQEPATLTLTTNQGLQLRVPADEQYEAWQITALNGETLFASPGDGGVAWVSPRTSN